MRTHVRLGRVFGVEIGLHLSWLAIAVLVAFSLATQFETTNPGWRAEVVWAAAALTSILFFVNLLAHELSHALVANMRGVRVRSVTLFALGGVAQMDSEPPNARSEFWIAIAGPAASVLIAAACLGAAWLAGWHPMTPAGTPGLAIVTWLGYINLTLAVFNLIPGYPLDGGRVLRAAVWGATGDALRSMRAAAFTGRMVAVLFIAVGLFRFAVTAAAGALWLAFIGWFLYDSARASYTQFRITEALRGVRVGDLMARDCPAADSRTNVENFVESHALSRERFCFLVLQDGRPVGLVTPAEVRDIPRPQWPYITLGDLMRPLENTPKIAPDALVWDALEEMGREKVNQLPVATGDHIEGVLSRAAIVGFIQHRAHMRI